MRKKIKEAIISDLSWTRDTDGRWNFEESSDDWLTIWNRSEDGYIYNCNEYRIDGCCIKGQEDKWKIKMLVIAITQHKEEVNCLNALINELEELKSNYHEYAI